MCAMPVSPKAVANHFLDHGEDIEPGALQNLVFLAHGWYLGACQLPLVNELVYACAHGPRFVSLHREFADYGTGPVLRRACEIEYAGGKLQCIEPTVSPKVKSFLDGILRVYGKFSSFTLSQLTQRQKTPWHEVVSFFGDEIPRHLLIPNELISAYFNGQFSHNLKRLS